MNFNSNTPYSTTLSVDINNPNQRIGSFLTNIQSSFLKVSTPPNTVYTDYVRNVRVSSGFAKDLSYNIILSLIPTSYVASNPNPNGYILDMNDTVMRWPYNVNQTTIQNIYNDMSIRNISYLGSLNQASDVQLKEDIEYADVSRCHSIFDSVFLKRFSWRQPHADTRVLGVLAPDIKRVFPKSVGEIHGIANVDSEQLEMAHIGVTKRLQQRVEALEALRAARGRRLSKI
jgi:hypothetical protein